MNQRFKAIPYSKRVYLLAKKKLEKNKKHQATFAAAAHNYGCLLIYVKQRERATNVLIESLKTLEGMHGSNSLALLDVLMDLGHATSQDSNKYHSKRHFARAIKIAIAHSSEASPVVAQLYYEMAGHPAVHGSRTAIKRLRKAQQIFSKELGADHARTALASYRLGLTLKALGEFSEAVPYLETAAKVFDKQSPLETYTINAHSTLISLYEKLGQGEMATKHCQAVGKIAAERGEKFPTGFSLLPLHTIDLQYPPRANRLGIEGYAVLELTVDKEGENKRPQNITLGW